MSAPRISVLHFSNSSVRGGAEEHILTLLRGLDPARFRLHLVCSPEVAPLLRPDLPGDVELLPLELCRVQHSIAAFRLARILRQRQVEILHSHLFYGSLFASPVGWMCRVPVIIETPHVREEWRGGWLKSRFFVDRFAGHFVDRYIAVSYANAEYLVKKKGLQSKKVVVIQNGCDLRRFDPQRPAPLALKRDLGFAESDPVLVSIGRLEPQKGHVFLLQAMTTVRQRHPNARLVCVGTGSLRESLEKKARQLGLQKCVCFVGQQSNVADWLALADFTVLASLYEGLPLVAVESLAAGRPVVATAVDGTPEVVVHNKTGLTVPPANASALAEAICRMLVNPELRQNLARTGREWVAARFSHQRQIRETQQFYLQAWEEKRRAEPAREIQPLPGDWQRMTLLRKEKPDEYRDCVRN